MKGVSIQHTAKCVTPVCECENYSRIVLKFRFYFAGHLSLLWRAQLVGVDSNSKYMIHCEILSNRFTCGDSNRHGFADEKIDKRSRNKKRNYSIVFSSSGRTVLHPAALSPECMIQRKIAAIYTEWQGQLAGIGPGGFEVWNRVKFKIGGQVVISSWEPVRPCVSLGRWSTLLSGWRILT